MSGLSRCPWYWLKDTLKAFNDFKKKQQKCKKWCFLICKSKCILKVYSIQKTIHWDRIQILKKFLSDKINGTINALFFLSQAPTHHSFTFNFPFLYELKHKVRLSKTGCEIFYFRFLFDFIKVYIFVQQNAWTSWLFEFCHNSFKNQNNRKATHSFAPRPLIFKLQQEILKFNNICESWSSQKTDLVINFLDFFK